MKSRLSNPYSLVAILVLFTMMVQARFWAPYWDTHNVQAILTWDVMGYYLYLPARFIYHDLAHLAFIPDIIREYAPTGSFYQAFPVPGAPADAPLVMKYTCGMAVLWTPFFWLGHWAAGWLHYPQDGFSAPYQVAIAFGGILYALLGLSLLRRVLLHYFPDVVTTLVLVLLVLGSNYLQYSVFDAAMPHNALFTLYALLLWLIIRWHTRPAAGWAAAIGLTLGLMALIRPSEAIAAVLPVLWGMTSLATARAKLALLRQRWVDVLLLLFFGALGVLPQLLYWKWSSGHFFYDSYGTGQTFSFLKPHLWSVLFSYRKGWLLYSPLLLMALAGFGVLWRRHRELAVPALVFFLLNLWVVSAWDNWWYGGSIGQRSMVQSYAVLALPWAAAVAWLLAPERRRGVQLGVAALSVLLIDLNLFQHWQYMRNIIHPEEMNRRYYFAVFNNTMPTQSDYALLDVKTHLPRAERHYRPRVVGTLSFEPPFTAPGVAEGMGYFSGHSYRVEAAREYSPALTLPLSASGLQPSQFVRASCQVFADYAPWGNQLVMTVERDGKVIQWNGVRMANNLSVPRAWTRVYFDAPMPADARPDDVLKIYVLNQNATACYIDDIQAELMEEVK